MDLKKQRSWVEINLEAIRENAEWCKKIAGPNSGIMAIIKADAYGHGLSQVAHSLRTEIEWFGVANLNEAIETKQVLGGLDRKILILSPLYPEEQSPAIQSGFSVSVSNTEEIAAFNKAASRLGKIALLHLAIDTGMGRMGTQSSGFSELMEAAKNAPHCQAEGVWSHLPSADEEVEFTSKQIAQFRDLVEDISNCHIHVANSAGLLGFQNQLDFTTLARTGLALYGVSPLPEKRNDLHPALSWKTRITLVREVPEGTSISYGRSFISETPMRTATLAVGYGDGYPRTLSHQKTAVLIAGTRCPLLGRVTMDQIVVDISHLSDDVSPGDEVVLLGEQGNESISANELAQKANTIVWEIFTGIGARVERVFL